MDREEAILVLTLERTAHRKDGLVERAIDVAIAALREQDTMKRLIMGEWVDCEAVQEALGIDFSTGLKMFDFSRTAAWNPAPLNGQKIETKFRLKQRDAEEVVRCKDCKHYIKSMMLCQREDGPDTPSKMDFCSYGERRET